MAMFTSYFDIARRFFFLGWLDGYKLNLYTFMAKSYMAAEVFFSILFTRKSFRYVPSSWFKKIFINGYMILLWFWIRFFAEKCRCFQSNRLEQLEDHPPKPELQEPGLEASNHTLFNTLGAPTIRWNGQGQGWNGQGFCHQRWGDEKYL